MDFKAQEHDSESPSVMAEINIIPLVDVMLVLLIIFMVTAPLSISGLAVELPTSKAKSAAIDEDRVIITVSKNGEFYFDKVKIPATALAERLQQIFRIREKKELYIRADRDVRYGAVIEAMSAAKSAGVKKMSMLTQAPKDQRRP